MSLTFDEFMRTHGRAAMRIARGDDEMFNECLAVRFQRFVGQYDGTGDIKAYVLMRMRYEVLRYSYKENLFNSRYGAELAFDVVDRDPPEEDERLPLIREALANLDSDIREVVTLWANGYTQNSISAELGVSARKVRARLSAGLTIIARELGHEIQA